LKKVQILSNISPVFTKHAVKVLLRDNDGAFVGDVFEISTGLRTSRNTTSKPATFKSSIPYLPKTFQ